MKYDFQKFAQGLTQEEIDQYNRLYRDVRTTISLSARQVLPFINTRQPTFLMTSALIRDGKDLSPQQRKNLQDSIHSILGDVRKKYAEEMVSIRNSGNPKLFAHGQFNASYLERLTGRVNKTMQEVSVLIANSLLGVRDPAVQPQYLEPLPDWREDYYKPAMTTGVAVQFGEYLERIADKLYIDPDEVYDFLYDVPDEDENTLSMDMFDEVADILEIEEVISSNAFYSEFDHYIVEIKEYFKNLAAKNKIESSKDERWFDMASQINEAMEEVAFDITRTGLVIARPTPPVTAAPAHHHR